jgi:valyl-tRNA synthetase
MSKSLGNVINPFDVVEMFRGVTEFLQSFYFGYPLLSKKGDFVIAVKKYTKKNYPKKDLSKNNPK